MKVVLTRSDLAPDFANDPDQEINCIHKFSPSAQAACGSADLVEFIGDGGFAKAIKLSDDSLNIDHLFLAIAAAASIIAATEKGGDINSCSKDDVMFTVARIFLSVRVGSKTADIMFPGFKMENQIYYSQIMALCAFEVSAEMEKGVGDEIKRSVILSRLENIFDN